MIYNSEAESSKIPPDWHLWIHFLTNNKPSSNYLPILKKLYDEHPDDWLLCTEIYEKIYSDPTLIGEKKLLKNHINKFAKNKMLSDVINRFINLIEA